jgi:hypothetical protein
MPEPVLRKEVNLNAGPMTRLTVVAMKMVLVITAFWVIGSA